MVSTLCLFILLGGGAYAAGRLTKNSVGSRELKPRAVGPANLKNRAVTFRKLHPSAKRRLRGARGAPGPEGAQGPPGDPAAIGLGVVGTANIAPTVPAARVTHDEEQTVEPSETKMLDFDEERYDTAGLHAAATSSRLTAPVPGVYLVTANVEWSPEGPSFEAAGARTILLVRNGNTVIASERQGPTDFDGTGSAENIVQAIATQALLAAGDYVDVRVLHSQLEQLLIVSFSGISSLEISPEFAMTWLAPGPAG